MPSAKKLRRWSQDDMQLAYEAANNGTLTVSAAARTYNVPRSTLKDRLSGKIQLDSSMGRPIVLGKEDEASLVLYVKYMA